MVHLKSNMFKCKMKTIHIHKDQTGYPASLKKYLSEDAPETITAIGNTGILRNKTLAVFSSVKCPGKIILKTYELMRKLRDDGVTVISGFHSPMEQECLNILLRVKQPVIICPARSIEGMRIKKEYRQPIEAGRLLLLSPFSNKDNRISSKSADRRNRFVSALADEILVPYAALKSKTEALCKELLGKGKTVLTFDSCYNKNLYYPGVKML
jgi:predicted Rossmann fold nucleotide-binding protein DprA/Smf involved in DNA uptake